MKVSCKCEKKFHATHGVDLLLGVSAYGNMGFDKIAGHVMQAGGSKLG